MVETGRRFSVVIVTLNGEHTLPGAVDSVLREGVQEGNVTVVDNGSTDGSMHALQTRFPQVKVCLNGTNVGFAKAANTGMRTASSEFLLLLNNDAELQPGCLAEFVAAFEGSPRLALAGGQLLYPDGKVQSAFAPLPTLMEEIVPRSLLKLLLPQRYRRTTRESGVREVPSVFGACLAARARALHEIGLLDEDFFFYFEEIDWCRRATARGWTVAYVSSARAQHIAGHTARRYGSGARIELERSKLIYFRKNLGTTKYAVLSAYLAVRAGINASTCGVYAALTRSKKEKLRRKAATYRDLFRWHLAGRPDSAGLPRRLT